MYFVCCALDTSLYHTPYGAEFRKRPTCFKSLTFSLTLVTYFEIPSHMSECVLCHSYSDKEVFDISKNDFHVITIRIYKDFLTEKILMPFHSICWVIFPNKPLNELQNFGR